MFYFINPEEIFNKNAREVSILNTFNEIAKNTEAKLITPTCIDVNLLNNTFHTDIKQSDILAISKKILCFKSTKIFNMRLLKIIKSDKKAIFFTRHLKVAKFIIKHKMKSQKLIFESHEIFYITNNFNKKLLELEKFVYKNSNGIVFNNNSIKNEAKKIFDISKSVTIYSGTQILEFKSKNFKKNEIAYFGSFLAWKGVDLILDLAIKNSDIKLFLYGNDQSKEGLELKNKYKEFKNIKFLGFIDHKDVLNELYDNERILIIPSIKSSYSNFSTPLKLYEYLSTSNIVIAPNFAPILEILDDKKDAFLYEIRDLSSLSNQLEIIKNMSSDDLNLISKNGVEKMQNFSYKNRALKIIDFSLKV